MNNCQRTCNYLVFVFTFFAQGTILSFILRPILGKMVWFPRINNKITIIDEDCVDSESWKKRVGQNTSVQYVARVAIIRHAVFRTDVYRAGEQILFFLNEIYRRKFRAKYMK